MKRTSTSKWPIAISSHATLIFFLFFFFSCQSLVASVDSLAPGESINSTQTLVSDGEKFVLKFFTPSNSNRWYLGVCLTMLPGRQAVWVANREAPIHGGRPTGVLTLTKDGRLVVTDGSTELWSTPAANITSPIARLMDNGNLVVTSSGGEKGSTPLYSWQSFEHPTDTMLPEMRIGVNLRTGVNTNITSWKSEDDPSPGDYAMGIDVRGVPQLTFYKSSKPLWRIGPWTGEYWSGYPTKQYFYNSLNVSYSSTKDEVSFVFNMVMKDILQIMVVNQTNDKIVQWLLSDGSATPFPQPGSTCDNYKLCGAYSICRGNNEVSCKCIDGFTSSSARGDCVRNVQLDCNGGTDDFVEMPSLKLPDTAQATLMGDVGGLEDCRAACLKNCSCTGYTSAKIDGTGCLMWFGNLDDITAQSEQSQLWFLRVATISSSGDSKKKFGKKQNAIVAVVCAVAGLILSCSIAYMFLRRKNRRTPEDHYREQSEIEDIDVPFFDFTTISMSTNDFSNENKLGEGGFGPVYKGTLANGEVVAVKRLSRKSSQGLIEFKNEVHLIAKLQHRNLVRLLGYSMHGDERILIYEYMPKKSLDKYLFVNKDGDSLNWQTRYQIIIGTARGLVYLHQDSRLRIIHRDLKAANILLDDDMNPKVSDFGTARILGGKGTEALITARVVGTFGYMSPEYAYDGTFSVKSDIFSFGVILLEVVSGMKNRSTFYGGTQNNLIGHVWKLWEEGNALELTDQTMPRPFPEGEVLKCIKIGLLCVENQPDDRPLMSEVMLMLDDNLENVREPTKPSYINTGVSSEKGTSSSWSNQESCSVNELSVSRLEVR